MNPKYEKFLDETKALDLVATRFDIPVAEKGMFCSALMKHAADVNTLEIFQRYERFKNPTTYVIVKRTYWRMGVEYINGSIITHDVNKYGLDAIYLVYTILD